MAEPMKGPSQIVGIVNLVGMLLFFFLLFVLHARVVEATAEKAAREAFNAGRTCELCAQVVATPGSEKFSKILGCEKFKTYDTWVASK